MTHSSILGLEKQIPFDENILGRLYIYVSISK